MKTHMCPACLSECRVPPEAGRNIKICPTCGVNMLEKGLIQAFTDDFWNIIEPLERQGFSITTAILLVAKTITEVAQ